MVSGGHLGSCTNQVQQKYGTTLGIGSLGENFLAAGQVGKELASTLFGTTISHSCVPAQEVQY